MAEKRMLDGNRNRKRPVFRREVFVLLFLAAVVSVLLFSRCGRLSESGFFKMFFGDGSEAEETTDMETEAVAAGRRFLLESGFPEKTVATYSDALILELWNSYKGEKIICVSSEDTPASGRESPANEMPELSFTLTIVARMQSASAEGTFGTVNYMDLIVSYRWDGGGSDKGGKDAIVIDWEKDLLSLIQAGFFSGYSYSETAEVEEILLWSEKDHSGAVTASESLGWEIPLGAGEQTVQYGDGRVIFSPSFPMTFYEDQTRNEDRTLIGVNYYHGAEGMLPDIGPFAGRIAVSEAFESSACCKRAEAVFSFSR